MQFSTLLRNAELDAIATELGVGGTLKFYTGSSPGVGVGATGTLLCTLTGVTFAAAAAGAVSFTSTADSSAAASGTPGYGRFATSGGTAKIDVTAGVGSGEANFTGAVALGGSVTETSGVITAGNA